jgi:hypothetical protein
VVSGVWADLDVCAAAVSDGRLPSRRWRPVALAAATDTTLLCVWAALAPRPLEGPVGVPMPDNPWGVQRAAGQFRLLFAITQPVTLGLAVLCLASLVLRSRRSRGVQRQQLKWFTYATLLGFGTWALLGFTGVHDRLADPLQAIVTILIGWLIPVAIGVAILRYRLYDIDRLINRTLVYGLLTALLASVYAGTVLVLGQVFGGVGRDPPSWAVQPPQVQRRQDR